MRTMYKFLFFLVAMLFCSIIMANNIQVSNIRLAGTNASDDYIMVTFDLSWENSWRTSSEHNNWDAAWIFVKYRVGTGGWQHAWLNNTGHYAGIGTSAVIVAGLLTPANPFNTDTNPGLGVFIYRSDDGTGTFSITGAQIRWNYGANSIADDATVDVHVFAIEMVYVPEGAFTVGSSGIENGSFTNGSWSSGATHALSISSESTLTIEQSSGNLWGTSSSGNNTIGGVGTLSADFPKGFAAFYCMKYEISQGQYRDFLNFLTRAQQQIRFASTTVGNYIHSGASQTTPLNRGGVRLVSDPGSPDSRVYACDLNRSNPLNLSEVNQSDDGEWIACNWLNWSDGAAFADWAGLRPMTELEFEKASRGTIAPVANEFAWGSTSITAANNITNSGANNEITNTTGANIAYLNQPNVQGPMRVGVFATNTNTREQAGASYYGIMEMSGNLLERIVTVGHATGRNFAGAHGNGSLSTSGNANITGWPGLVSGEVTGANGSGFRGGNWSWTADTWDVRTSDRRISSFADNSRTALRGFRAVRSAQ